MAGKYKVAAEKTSSAVQLADGRWAVPDSRIQLDDDQEAANQTLIDEGILVHLYQGDFAKSHTSIPGEVQVTDGQVQKEV